MNPHVKELALRTIGTGIYKKNIHYMWGPAMDINQFIVAKVLAGSAGMSGWVIQKAYHKLGIQMQVSKDVSDDLLATDFDETSKIENIPWPAPVIEMFFEDPGLPSILIMKTKPEMLAQWFTGLEIGLKSEEYITALMQEGSGPDATQLSLQLNGEMYADFLTNAQSPPMGEGILSYSLNEADNASICYMIHLALKVLIFSSIPQYKPLPLTKKEMTHGGKPDVKGRPARPSFHSTYLPKVVYEKQKATHVEGGRDFRGRRGHIRWYHNERFTHRKDTWDFVPPVKDPHTGKYPERATIKVRKP